MCGRYTLIRLSDFIDAFPWIGMSESPMPGARYNIAPSQDIAVVANDGRNRVDFYRWGLVPGWAKDASIGSRMINARAETLAEKPAYRSALKGRRCLIPADGFYEWKLNPDGKTKTPMYIRLKGGKPFAFAGLWETWRSDDGSPLHSCAIITTEPNELLATIHNRMAVILPEDRMREWIGSDEMAAARARELLVPYPSERMEAHPVSRTVNNPGVDSARCIEPAEAPVDEGSVAAEPPRSRAKRDRARRRGSKPPGGSEGLLF